MKIERQKPESSARYRKHPARSRGRAGRGRGEGGRTVIKSADYIIDLGPEGGDHGGNVVICGKGLPAALALRPLRRAHRAGRRDRLLHDAPRHGSQR